MQNTQERERFDFPVALVPIFTRDAQWPEHGYVEAPKRLAVQRTDNAAVLGVVSDKYKILPHAQVVEGFRAAFSDVETRESIRVTKGGARMFLSIVVPSIKMEVRPGDFVQLQLTAVNSYDATRMLQVMFGAFRLVCSNGAIIGERVVNVEQRHVGEIGLTTASIAHEVENVVERFKESLPLLQKMSSTESGIGAATLRGEAFSPEQVKLPEYLLAAAYDEFVRAKDDTQWGYYNAMTYAITHKMRRESPEAQVRYGRIAWQAAQALV